MSLRNPATLLVAGLLCVSISMCEAQARGMLTSYYGGKGDNQGSKTASGFPFNPNDPTIAAHRTLPFGTVLRVYSPITHVTLTMVVRDRGPFAHGRSLDVSHAAGMELGLFRPGVAVLQVSCNNPACN
jgi:rare lipoprotein A